MKRVKLRLIDVVVIVFSVGLLIVLFRCFSRPSGERSRRSVCAANVRGIGQSCKIYANDFNDSWPIPPHDPNTFVGLSPIGTHRKDGDRSHGNPSIGQAFWLLVRSGGTTNKQYICPGEGCSDEPDSTANPMTYYDFTDGSNLSYGYQYPYGPSAAPPTESLDPGMAMIADKCSTYFGLARLKDTMLGPGTWQQVDWKPFNSKHHLYEAQNVLYQDGHAEFAKTPACGMSLEIESPAGKKTMPDLIYENRQGVFGGDPGGWPLDINDSVIVHGPSSTGAATSTSLSTSASR